MRFVLSIVLTLASSFVLAEQPGDWSFFGAERSFKAEWGISRGVARVEMVSEAIKIEIYEVITIHPGRTEVLSPEVTESIEGTITPSGQINAIHIIHNSDAGDMKIHGRYYRREEKERWGEKDVVVAYETIIFEDEAHVFGFTRRKRL